MLYWAIYDVSSNAVRNRIVNVCKDFGLKRVQKSVFLGELSRNRAGMLAFEVQKELGGGSDAFFLVPSCESCIKAVFAVGEFDAEAARKQGVVFV